MSLIDTLLDDHKDIFRLLDECQQLGIASDEGKRRLTQARAVIIAHLRREDTRLYPAMERYDDTRELGRTYSGEMHGISADVSEFFETYAHGGSGLDYARRLGRVISNLRQRMTREEQRLYPAFRAHCE